MTVYVFGDSHGQYLFARTAATRHCLPGHTMHRVGRDGLVTFPGLYQPTPEDAVVFTFGEIDVRCHLLRVAAGKGWTYQAAVADLAQRYVAALSAWLDALPCRPKACVLGVVPPIDPLRASPILPVHGPLRDRLVVWFLLNEALKARAREAGLAFVPIPKVYHARDGSLKRALSDGHAHIAKDCTGPLVEAVRRSLDVDLTFFPLPARRHLVRSTMRRMAILIEDSAALWALGESNIEG